MNSVETYQGGTHVTYAINQIVDSVRAFIKKKHKVDVLPGDIRGHMRIYIAANINRPRFSSQTKENMISPAGEWKTSWTVPDKFIQKLVKTNIIQSILDWAAAKQNAADMAEIRKLGKGIDKADPRKVPKFSDAMERTDRHKCVIFLAEGDSAAKSVQGGRGNNPYIGSFPLKGKPLSVRDKDVKQVMENKEIQNILTIIGLKPGVKVTSSPAPDGEWVELEINGKTILANEYDTITIDGKKIKVSTLL